MNNQPNNKLVNEPECYKQSKYIMKGITSMGISYNTFGEYLDSNEFICDWNNIKTKHRYNKPVNGAKYF